MEQETPQVSSGGNFEAALETAAAGTDSPAVSPTTTPTDAASAETTPAGDGSPPSAPEREPFIPRQRFDEVNARMTTAEAKLQQLAWAEQVNREHVLQAQQIGHQWNTQREQFLDEALREALSDPVMASKVTPIIARHFQSLRNRPDDPEPQPDLVDQNNQPVAMSFQRQREWFDWNKRQESRAQHQQAMQQQALVQQANAQAAQELADARTWPGFKEHEADIKAALMADQKVSLAVAYARIVPAKLQAKLQAAPQQAEAKVVAQFKEKAQAATGKPGATTSGPKNYKGNFEKALEDAAAAASSR